MTKVSNDKVRSELIRLIESVAGKHSLLIGKITAVDEDKLTCDIEPADGGGAYHDVRLKPSLVDIAVGIIMIPEVGSQVVFSNLQPVGTVIVSMDKIKTMKVVTTEELWLRANDYSLVNGEEMENDIKRISSRVDKLFDAILNGVPAPGAADGGAGYKASMATILGTAQPAPAMNKLLNEKVKHG